MLSKPKIVELDYNKELGHLMTHFINELISMNQYVTFVNIESDDINELLNVDIDSVVNNCNKFNSYLDNNDLFNLFLKKKTKLFSHKSDNTKNLSEVLFGDKISMRDVLTTQNNKTKDIIWNYLHNIYLHTEHKKETPNTDRIKLFEKLSDSDNCSDNNKTQLFENIIDEQSNDKSKDLLKDIVGSFDTLVTDNQEDLMNNVINFSKKMNDKYKNDIENNTIDINGILNNVMSHNKNNASNEMISNLMGKLTSGGSSGSDGAIGDPSVLLNSLPGLMSSINK